MAETYSIGITGVHAHNPTNAKSLTLPDSSARTGGELQAMASGKQLLCQRPDGSQAYFVLDASRSDPARNLFYLLKV